MEHRIGIRIVTTVTTVASTDVIFASAIVVSAIGSMMAAMSRPTPAPTIALSSWDIDCNSIGKYIYLFIHNSSKSFEVLLIDSYIYSENHIVLVLKWLNDPEAVE